MTKPSRTLLCIAVNFRHKVPKHSLWLMCIAYHDHHEHVDYSPMNNLQINCCFRTSGSFSAWAHRIYDIHKAQVTLVQSLIANKPIFFYLHLFCNAIYIIYSCLNSLKLILQRFPIRLMVYGALGGTRLQTSSIAQLYSVYSAHLAVVPSIPIPYLI